MTRKATILIAIFFFFSSVVYSQTRTITGKIIDQSFLPISGANIFTSDTALLGKTDSAGNFSISLPSSTNFLRIAAVGLEWKFIQLHNDCNQIDVVLLYQSSYDFMTLQEVDRLRKKEFKKMPKLHAKGFEKGILSTRKPCYDDIFISVAERHD